LAIMDSARVRRDAGYLHQRVGARRVPVNNTP
jgi:hypothetical protein